jgi:hypothetical protein
MFQRKKNGSYQSVCVEVLLNNRAAIESVVVLLLYRDVDANGVLVVLDGEPQEGHCGEVYLGEVSECWVLAQLLFKNHKNLNNSQVRRHFGYDQIDVRERVMEL